MKTSNKILWAGAAAFVLLFAVAISKQMHRYREANPHAERLLDAIADGRIGVVAIEGEASPALLEKIGRGTGALYMWKTIGPEDARIAHDTLYLSGTAIGRVSVPGAVYLLNGEPIPVPHDAADSTAVVKTTVTYRVD